VFLLLGGERTIPFAIAFSALMLWSWVTLCYVYVHGNCSVVLTCGDTPRVLATRVLLSSCRYRGHAHDASPSSAIPIAFTFYMTWCQWSSIFRPELSPTSLVTTAPSVRSLIFQARLLINFNSCKTFVLETGNPSNWLQWHAHASYDHPSQTTIECLL